MGECICSESSDRDIVEAGEKVGGYVGQEKTITINLLLETLRQKLL